MLDPAAVWRALAAVHDPEIPGLSVVDLGVIRGVQVSGQAALIELTPTFAGCPALDVMRADIEARVRALGADPVEVRLVLHPPWTTDSITPAGRAKLQSIGLAPPPPSASLIQLILPEAAACPYCQSTNTSLKNSFGPTLCRALYYCHHCRQPFEQFKAL